MPDLTNIHIDVFLTNLSIAYTNEAYVANQVMPVVPVDKRSNKYPIYNKDAFLRPSGKDAQGRPTSIRRPKTRSNEIEFDVSNNSYYCEQLARNYPLSDAEVNIADMPLQPQIDATMAVTETVTLDNEIAVAGKAMKRANYASGNKVQLTTGGSGTSWLSYTSTNSLPFSDLTNGKTAVIGGLVRPPNKVLMNYAVAVTLSQHPEYLKRLQYVTKEGLTSAGLLPVLVGLEVVEARAQYVNSAEGATITNTYVWVDDQGQNAALVYYQGPGASLRQPAYGYTFEAPDDTLGARGFLIKRWREEWRDVEVIECRTTRDWRFTATDGSANGDNSNGYALGAYLISGCTL